MGGAALLLLGTACTGTDEPSETATPAHTSTGSRASSPTRAELVARLRARLTPPALPSFTLPTDVLTDATNQRIAEQLQVLPGLYRDIAVLDGYCDAPGT
jgi:OOP family OmpA-OmpF porin